jgi:aminoglycoside phosphotransferase (APT) family kinase protein
MVHDATEAQRAAMWRAAVETMARLHALDYRTLGFGHLRLPGTTPLQQQLDYWQAYLDWALEGDGHAICQAALDWLGANQPGDEPTVLCWGDSRLGNIIFRESVDGIAAVLDWEMAVLGNPVQDLAWFNYLDATFSEGLGIPRLAGLPGYEETVQQWERATGFATRDYNYYLIFAGMRYALLLSRIMLATGQVEQVQENFACQLLQKYMERLT